jgi:hypothetical protein
MTEKGAHTPGRKRDVNIMGLTPMLNSSRETLSSFFFRC